MKNPYHPRIKELLTTGPIVTGSNELWKRDEGSIHQKVYSPRHNFSPFFDRAQPNRGRGDTYWCTRESRMCVRGWTAAPCYDERAERRGRWNGARIWYNVATSFIKEVLAVCHVAPHNEAALGFGYSGAVACVLPSVEWFIVSRGPKPTPTRLFLLETAPRYTRTGIRWPLLTSHVEQKRHV